ncbi:MAG TPA: PGPGW domain-containing protein [Candidatus Sulfomarinibacteraceae bacterium]|nr:PGPGW domain-containing protein [Candidatus Sulfomarinibacteraceae bacterium]
MAAVVAWVREHAVLFQVLGAASLAMFVLSLVVFPLVVISLPPDYFVRERRDPVRQLRRRPLLWAAVMVVKNLLGAVLIAAGVAMLVLPGQGLLTILVGLALTNFPGKFTLERRLVRVPSVGRALNRIRTAAGRPPLEIPLGDG